MKKINIILPIILLSCLSATDSKLAQTGFQFLSVSSNASAGGMGDAVTTQFLKSSSLFYNPAGIGNQKASFDISINQNNWIAGIIHNAITASFRPRQGQYGVFGVSFLNVNYGEIQGTMVWDNDQGFIDTEIIKPTALSFGLGYAKALSDQFYVGGHIKNAYQSLGRNVIPTSDTTRSVIKNTAHGVAFDFGTIYQTGWKGFDFGMSVRNFSQEIKYQTEAFQLPLTFTMGASIDLLQLFPFGTTSQELIFSIDASHPRSYKERMNIGLNYRLSDLFSLKTGYLFNYDEQSITAGAGFQKSLGVYTLGIHYAYTPFGVFDHVQRVSFQLSF